jgi:glycosyltransferase involved in cell wall biosynthesis
MRVAHVGNYNPDSSNGVDKTIAGLVRHLPEHGVEIEIWHPSRRVDELRQRHEDGVTIYDLPVRRAIKGACRFSAEAERFVRDRARSVDLLHLHSVFQRENLKLARLGVPYVVTPNGGYADLVLRGRNQLLKTVWLRLWERPFLARARAIHAVSLPEVRMIERFGLPIPVQYIPNGLEDAVLDRPATRPSEQKRYVYLGRLAIEQKGLDLLLQGYAKAVAEVELLPDLVLAGPDFRSGRTRLESLARSLGIAERVIFTGTVQAECKWDLLLGGRLFIHTSRWEGMPFALLEALAVGRPTLITPATNLAQEITEAKAGNVVTVDPDAIAAGLVQAARLPGDELDRMGERARAVAREKFAWAAIAERMSRQYRAALAGPSWGAECRDGD